MAEKLGASASALLLISVILLSIGGIYLGVFTPVEAAGVGACIVTVLAVVTGKPKFGHFPNILIETVTMTAMRYLIITGLGFDPIWFGVIEVIVIEMGLIKPPVGINLFVVKGVAADVPMWTVFRGVFPFWLAMAACLLPLVLFPQIALVLPEQMK